MSLATKETINNDNEVEEILEEVKSGERKVIFFNKKVFKACILIIIQLEIVLFFACVNIENNPLVIEVDWGFFLQSQQIEIVPVVIAGMSSSSNMKIKKMRDSIVEQNAEVISKKDAEIKAQNDKILSMSGTIQEKNEQIWKLKIRLDDISKTRQVTQEALDRAQAQADSIISTENNDGG